MSVPLVPTADGVLVPVHAQPRAKRSAVVGVHGERLKVAVTAAPEKGKANEEIIEVLADALKLKRSQIALSAGAGSRQKTFVVSGVEPDELRRRIEACLGG